MRCEATGGVEWGNPVCGDTVYWLRTSGACYWHLCCDCHGLLAKSDEVWVYLENLVLIEGEVDALHVIHGIAPDRPFAEWVRYIRGVVIMEGERDVS